MKNSPLRLEKLFFTRVFIHAHPEGRPDAKWEVEAVPEIVRQSDQARKWAVSLRVNIKQAGDKKPAYHGEIEIGGFFSVDEGWPEDRMEQLVHANGCAVLFSAVREMVCNVTGRGPWPMLVLPTVSFVDSAPKPAGKVAAAR
jgi:preprotein translocase subunit SecB